MDSITDFISQSIENITKDKARINSITEENLPGEIDIQL